MQGSRNLLISITLVVLIIFWGTLGYVVIEGWDFLDALYMTVITLTTVGYGEVNAMSRVGKYYTILLIVFGVSFFLYMTGNVIRFTVEGQIRKTLGRRMLDKKIDRLKDHFIICGYGRIGMVLCKDLGRKPVNLVVIENKPEQLAVLEETNILYINGDATVESVLLKAGIKRAKGLVGVLATDIDNVFLVLTARQLNPDIFIMARAIRNESMDKLKAAGADQVESPYEIGAARMAQRILRPTVINFLDITATYKSNGIQMDEIPVGHASIMTNVILKDSGIRQKYNLIIIAIKKADGNMLFNPSYETVLQAGDTVIALGKIENLCKLEKKMNP